MGTHDAPEVAQTFFFSEAIFVAWRRRKHDKNVPQALGLPDVPLRTTAASTGMTPGKK